VSGSSPRLVDEDGRSSRHVQRPWSRSASGGAQQGEKKERVGNPGQGT